MKYLFYIVSISFLVLLSSSAFGQGTPWVKYDPYKLIADKKESFYCSKANQLAKAGNYRAAILNACKCYSMTESQKKLKKSAERLIEYFPLAETQSADQVQELKNTGASPVDKKAEATFNAHIILQEQITVVKALQNLPKKKCKKCPELNFDLIDYEPKRAEMEKGYNEIARQAADKHYTTAQQYAQDRSRLKSLSGVRACKNTLFYKRDHQQAQALLATLKPYATTRLSVLLLKNNAGMNLIPTVDWTNAIITESRKKLSPKLDLFQLLAFDQTEPANVLLEPSIENIIISEKRKEPVEKKCECAIKIGEKEVVLKATVTTHSKYTDIIVDGLSTIIDKSSGKIISSHPIKLTGTPWSYSWATFTGDKRTFDCKKYRFYKRFLAKKEVGYPGDSEVISPVKEEVVGKFRDTLIQYSEKIGY